MNPLFWLFDTIVNLFIWLIIGQAVLSLLTSFNIVNTRQPLVAAIGEFLYRATEPVIAPVRRRMPDLGPIDIAPMVVIIGILFVHYTVHWLFGRF